jgi:hypothetical protein
MVVTIGAVLYRAAQELGWVWKDVILFPFLLLLAWVLALYWLFTGPRAARFYRKTYKEWAREKRFMAYGLAISIGALIGGASGAGWWKVFELHRQQMSVLQSKESPTESTKAEHSQVPELEKAKPPVPPKQNGVVDSVQEPKSKAKSIPNPQTGVPNALVQFDIANKLLDSDPDKLTLYDLYLTDFGGSDVRHGRTTIIKGIGPVEIKIESTVIWQLETGTEFVMLYVPYTKYTSEVCIYLRNEYKRVIEEAGKSEAGAKTPGESEQVSSRKLVFSNRVFIYHEAYLSPEQILEIKNFYPDVTPLFRSTDYLATRKLEAKVAKLEKGNKH